jgi:hypothetical protein
MVKNNLIFAFRVREHQVNWVSCADGTLPDSFVTRSDGPNETGMTPYEYSERGGGR